MESNHTQLRKGFTVPVLEPLAFPTRMVPLPRIELGSTHYQRVALTDMLQRRIGGMTGIRIQYHHWYHPLSRRCRSPNRLCIPYWRIAEQSKPRPSRASSVFETATGAFRLHYPYLAESGCVRCPYRFRYHLISNQRRRPGPFTFHIGG